MPEIIICPNHHRFVVRDEESSEKVLRCPTCQIQFTTKSIPFQNATALSSTVLYADEQQGTTSSSDFSIGQLPRVENYELRKKLGEGGMGSVFLARQVEADREVALKLIRPERLTDGNSHQAIKRLRIEARAAARLEHDHIVPVYEVGESDGVPFYSMRYVEGSNLQELLRSGPLPGREACRRLEPVARALQAAHQQGVLHRDIKPANLLWDAQQKRLLIGDFGLAKLTADSRLTRQGEVFGSPAYMSPEQALGRKLDARSDVYSLGATLYQAITGRPPFQGESVPQTLRMVVEDQPVAPRALNPKVDRDLENICLKCLRKNPQQRYQSAADFADDLKRYLEHRPVKARPLGPLQKAARCGRRHPVATSLAGVAFSAIFVALVYLQTRPAFLHLNINPPDARVLLDGEPLSTAEGTALIESSPGRHELALSAAGHRTQREKVVLVRGRGNMVALDVDLVPLLGRLHLTSDPPGAEVKVFNSTENLIAEGFTPFVSDAIPTGEHQVRFRKELYKPVTRSARVPDGHQTLSLETVLLQPESEGTKQYERLQKLHGKLMKNIEQPRRFQDWPLHAVVEQMSGTMGLPMDLNQQALARIGMSPDQPITGTLASGPWFIGANQFLDKYGLVLRPIVTGEKVRGEVTALESRGEMTTILYPVGDLISPLRPDWNSLKENLFAGTVPGTWEREGGRGTLTLNRELMALSIRHRWGAHLEIYQYLNELKRRHVEGQSQGLVIKSEDERAAVDAAQQWLKLMDQGKYEESWKQASKYLQRQFNQKNWTRARQATPHPKTRAKTRVLDQFQFLPKAPPGLGEAPAVILRFRTPGADFDLYEIVALAKLEGRWQPTGYQITQAPANPIAPRPARQTRKTHNN